MKVHILSMAGSMLIGSLFIVASNFIQAKDQGSIAIPDNELVQITAHELQKAPVARKSTQEQIQEYMAAARTARRKGDLKQAVIYYQKVIGVWPTNVDAWVELGNLWYEKTNYKEALHCYRKALEFKPDIPALHHNIELCIKKQGNLDDTQGYYEQMMRLYPQDAKNYLTYSKLLRKKKKVTEALSVLTKALNVIPDDPAIYREIGTLYREQNIFDKATEFLRKAVELAPDNTSMLLELANTCCIMDEYDEALLFYNKAFEIDPSLNNALYNIGYTLKRQGNINAAIEVLEKVVERDPEFAQAHFGLGLGYLVRARDDDDWIRGWLEYEWRWRLNKELHKQYYNKPFWNGSDLAEKTILVICEQGYGDTFQFIRYAKSLKNMGARVICLSPQPLKQYLSIACDYLDEVVVANDPLPDFDVQVYLMSIPHMLKTTEKTIPAEIPYLSADAELISYWHERLAKDDGIKIGICWQGNSNYSTDALKRVVAAKSLAVNKLAPLAAVDQCNFYSLQKISGTTQLENLNDMIIHDFGYELDEEHGRFMDTAAIIKNLDLVITVDTSISHLAAGLGVETWILLPTPSDWRWMYNRTDTPWYPNVRLFRQPKIGDWEGMVNDVVEALADFVKQRKDQLPGVKKKNSIQNSENQFNQLNDQSTEDLLFALPPNEFMDQFTLLAIQKGSPTVLNSGALEDHDRLIQQHHLYVQKNEQMPVLLQGLYAVNCYLTVMMNEFNDRDYDISSIEGEEQIARLNRALKLKRLMKEEIKRLMD